MKPLRAQRIRPICQAARRPARNLAGLCLLPILVLGCCLLGRDAGAQGAATVTAPPAAPVSALPQSPQAVPASRENILTEIEDAVADIVQFTAPSVVTIEGRVPLFGYMQSGDMPAYGAASNPFTFGRGLSGGQEFQNGKGPREGQGSPPEPTPPGQAGQTRNNAVESYRLMFSAPTTGSGFVIEGGFVVTSAEVTAGMQDPVVILSTGQRFKVDWVNSDQLLNICVLKVSGLPADLGLRWGDSDRVLPGKFAITIGNQAGFANSVSLGMIAGINRCGQSGSRRYDNLIQFQGSVGAGSSGGPLLNSHGEVVGMVVAMSAGAPSQSFWFGSDPNSAADAERAAENAEADVTIVGKGNEPGGDTAQETPRQQTEAGAAGLAPTMPVPGSQALSKGAESRKAKDRQWIARSNAMTYNFISTTGFAIPSNDLKRIMVRLKTGEKIVRHIGWLGVQIGSPAVVGEVSQGALIRGVYIGSPADRDGLQPGDLVLKVDERPIRTGEDLKIISQHLIAGQKLHFLVRRGEQNCSLLLVVQPKPDNDTIDHTPVRDMDSKTGSLPARSDCPRSEVAA